MDSFLEALNAVSTLNFHVKHHGGVKPWHLVMARGAMGLAWGFAGALLCWLLPHDRLVGALLGTAVAVVLRHFLCRPDERTGIRQAAVLLTPRDSRGRSDEMYSSIAINGALILRPFCIFILLMHGCWLWTAAAAALSLALPLELKDTENHFGRSHWYCAFAITVAAGVLCTLLGAGAAMFVFSLLTCAIAWLTVPFLRKMGFSTEQRFCVLYLVEAGALILGLLFS